MFGASINLPSLGLSSSAPHGAAGVGRPGSPRCPALALMIGMLLSRSLGRPSRVWRTCHVRAMSSASAVKDVEGGAGAQKVRSYPTEPRVGVGAVILRQLTPHKQDAEVLLIQRGKEPNKGEQRNAGAAPHVNVESRRAL